MKVGDGRPVSAVGAVRGGKATAPVGAVAPVDARSVADITSIAGISEAELTPAVRTAIAGLMAEVDRLRREVAEAKARTAYLEKLAVEDSLMPVANRRAFVRELSRLMSFAQRYGSTSSVVYLDVNGMKRINDTFGHTAGDAALQQVARVLTEHVRNSDVVGRLGGDEFGVLLVQTDQTTAEEKAAKLADAIERNPAIWNGEPLTISAAWGAYAFTGEENVAQAIDAADRAMYLRKQASRAGGLPPR